jgi:hypothetical protein
MSSNVQNSCDDIYMVKKDFVANYSAKDLSYNLGNISCAHGLIELFFKKITYVLSILLHLCIKF